MVRLTDRPDMTLDVYRGRKTTIQPTNQSEILLTENCYFCPFLQQVYTNDKVFCLEVRTFSCTEEINQSFNMYLNIL